MSLQKKLLLTYSILIIILVIAISLFFFRYNSNMYITKAYANLADISERMSRQLDNLVAPMDFITYHLLSYEDIITSLSVLANMNKDDPQNLIYINESRRTINGTLLSYSIAKNFHRVSIFNGKGEFFTSNIKLETVNSCTEEQLNSLGWISEVKDASGKWVILPPYLDPWAISDEVRVFSLARCVQGSKGQSGYIEVQHLYSEVEKIFNFPNQEGTKVIALTKQGEIFFCNYGMDTTMLDYYKQLICTSNSGVTMVRNKISESIELLACMESSYTGIKIMLIQDRNTLLKPLFSVGYMTFLVGFLLLVISLMYIYVFSKKFTKPIRQLKESMENTDLDNLNDRIAFRSSNNEIEALNHSFKLLRKRLNEAVLHKLRSQSLQIQANFDSLQAQVNPHFIYNILNVLSSKGFQNGDDEICEICNSIASMLRYSTSTLERTATIYKEIGHISNYLLLMKKRYEHKLEFKIDIDNAIHKEPIPKIVLQQFVENSLNHGYENISNHMLIEVNGYICNGWWHIEINDNGQGFDAEVLVNLKERVKSVKEELLNSQKLTGFAIGGMGIVNTYARLQLFYGEAFQFTMENKPSGGAKVTFGSKLNAVEGSEG